MSTSEQKVAGLYYTIIEGSFRTKVDKDHPQAIRREYETKDKTQAVKYEQVFNSLTGYIMDMGMYDSDYGKVINIKLDENGEGKTPILQFSTQSNYGEDLMKKLSYIDFTKELKFRPYAFEDEDSGKEIRGVAISYIDNGEEMKLGNFFRDTEKKINTNGHPNPDENAKENYSTEDWKIYFMQVRKFLIEYTQANILPKLQERGPLNLQPKPSTLPNTDVEYPEGPEGPTPFDEEQIQDNEEPPD